jgi:hypothetical protein
MMNFTDGQLIILTYTSILMLILPGAAELIYEYIQGKKRSGIDPVSGKQVVSDDEFNHPHAA